MEYKKVKLQDVVTILGDGIHGTPKYTENGEYYFINGNNLANGKIIIKSDTKTVDYEEYKKYKKDLNDRTLLVSINGTLGNVAVYNGEKCILGKSACYFNIKEDVNKQYIQYILYSKEFQKYIQDYATGTTIKNMSLKAMREYEFILPRIEVQNKITKILSCIDKKIELNNQINDNLEKQLIILFNEMFFKNIKNNNTNEFEKKILYDVLEVIDNRGKTPKLVETSDYPILDVRALSGNGRIINYDMCEKYVDEEVYNTFFRSGHPKKNDILLSTVGSLAEMKLFIENKGTVAQNVVALRSKIDYPMYIYQYLKAIKSVLISYNIGSVQPSIKVTQFMKHSFYLPKSDELRKFENISVAYTNKMFNLHKEIESLTQLRDTLLPKLMNGEIDLDKIEI